MELGFLKPLLDRPGPWASVYIETTRATEDALRQQMLRNRAVAEQLIDAGANARTVRTVTRHLAEEPAAGTPPGRAIFATGTDVVLDIPLSAAPVIGEATWSMLPHLSPLAAYREDLPPCMVARIDRTGADLELRDSLHRRPVGRAEGRDFHGHRSVPADRQEWHYRNRAENLWNENAELIAAELTRRWPESGAEMLVLVGDPRERRTVYNRLPEAMQALTVEVERGSRAAGTSNGQLDMRITQVRREQAHRRLESALERFEAGRSRPGEAAEGVPAVVDAVRTHRVETLLLAQAAPDAGRDVWIGPDPDQIAVEQSEAHAMGVAHPERVHADDALIRSATAVDADVRLIPEGMPGPTGGIGAVLRWTF